MKRGPKKLWSVCVRESGVRSGRWNAWIDLPNGWCATTYYPDETRAQALKTARMYRDGLRQIAEGKNREKKR